MAIAFVTGQQVANQGVNVTSLALTFGSNVTNGNGIIVVVGCKSGTLADPTFTGTGFGTTVLLKKEASSGSAGTCWIFGIPATGGGAALVLHCSSAIIGACALEFSGVDTTFTTDGTNGNLHAAAGSQTTTPGSITTANANDLIVTVSDWVGINTITTPPSGYTAMTQAQTTGTNGNTVQGYYEIVSSTTTTNPATVLSTGSVAWVAAIAAIKASGGGSTTPQSLVATAITTTAFLTGGSVVNKGLKTTAVTTVASILKQMAKALTVTPVTTTATIIKSVGKTLKATAVTTTAILAASLAHLVTLAATAVTTVATITKQVGKTLLTTAATTASTILHGATHFVTLTATTVTTIASMIAVLIHGGTGNDAIVLWRKRGGY